MSEMRDFEVPQEVWDRFNQLRDEDESVKKMSGEQVGTSIPRLFYQMDSYVTDPSSVGTGIISRMIETDDAVSSAMQFKILMIMAKIGDYHHEIAEISDFVNGFLKRMKGPTWNESMEAMLSCKGYGFSVSEICMAMDEKMRKVPVRLPTYHPSTIVFKCDSTGQITENGVIQFVLQQTQFSNPNSRLFGVQYGDRVKNPFTTPTDRVLPYRIPFLYQYGMVFIPRNKVIHMTNLPMFSFGSPYGKTEVRVAHLSWQLKQYTMKQMGVAVKRSANGIVWGTAPKGGQNVKVNLPDGSTKEVTPTEALRNLLSQRENDDAIVTHTENDGYKITMLPAAGNLDGYLNVLNNLDIRIFRSFLLPSLVMTDGSAGSRALGDKHFEIVDKVSESESTKFGQCIINDMIEPIIRANYGEQKGGYGTFKQRPQTAEERNMLAQMFSTLTTSGIMKTHVPEDMNYMRQAMSLPKDFDKSFDLGGSSQVIDGDNPPSGDSPGQSNKEEPEPKEVEAL